MDRKQARARGAAAASRALPWNRTVTSAGWRSRRHRSGVAQVREFWTSNGFVLKRDDPTIGIMGRPTGWENRADIPQDGLRGNSGYPLLGADPR